SFATDASDSVGGANGTLVAPSGGAAASIANGLVLPGNTVGGNGYSGYVSLPAGILTNTTSLTVECWMAQNQGNTWAEAWDFGVNNNVNFALIPTPPGNNNGGNMEVADNPANNDIYTASGVSFPNGSTPMQYVAFIFNDSSLTGNLYTNGMLVATQSYPDHDYTPGNIGGAGGTTQNYLGNDVYGDWQFDGAIYEFRIWNGVVPPVYLAASTVAGPGVVITNTTPQSLNVSVVTTMLTSQIQQASVVGNFLQVSGVPVTDAVTNWASSNPGVLTVDGHGVITAIGPGNAKISATVAGVTGTSATITVGKPTIAISRSGSGIVLSWPAGTILLQAPTVHGPWTTNNTAVSPYPVSTTSGSQFFRLQVSP
ncbi:MAG TPA: LamG-like jellyroll fold domain-containing protein, partial [Candidatus Acidoferrum sp.]|nr:LamG-like jellyroll fold domain-containing protein [Candidatus Acidoferrum sp.]